MNTTAVKVGVGIGAGILLMGLTAAGMYAYMKPAPVPPPPPTPVYPTLPAEMKIAERGLLKIPVMNPSKDQKWINWDEHVQLIPWPTGEMALVTCDQAGVYHVGIVGLDSAGKLGEPSGCKVTVGTPPPVPPGPGPGPGPNPPVPPGPTDPLTQALQLAYGQETEADKAKSLNALQALYEQGAKAAKERTDLTTWGALFQALTDVANAVGVKGKILKVQTVIQSELKRALPTDTSTKLDDAGRNLAQQTFAKMATALAGVKP